MTISAPLLAELQKRNARIFPVMEMNLPSETVRWSRAPVNSLTRGPHQSRVLSWPTFVRDASDQYGGLRGLEGTVKIADHDFRFRRELNTYGTREIMGISAMVRLLAQGVDDEDALQIPLQLTAWSQSEPLTWDLLLRPDDRWLRGNLLKRAVNAGDFPAAPGQSLGLFYPLVYGKHDSAGTTNAGAVPLINLGNGQYGGIRGWAVGINRVFDSGVRIETGWSVVRPVINNQLFTILQFDLSTYVPVGDITADVDGYEDVGDGSGDLITNPSERIKHVLINFGYNDYNRGDWLALGDTPFSTDLADDVAVFSAAKGTVSARYYGDAMKVDEALAEACVSAGYRCFWTWDCKIGLSVIGDNRVATPVRDIHWDHHIITSAGATRVKQESELKSQVAVKTIYGEASGIYHKTTLVKNPLLTGPLETINLRASRATVIL